MCAQFVYVFEFEFTCAQVCACVCAGACLYVCVWVCVSVRSRVVLIVFGKLVLIALFSFPRFWRVAGGWPRGTVWLFYWIVEWCVICVGKYCCCID